MAQGPYKSTHGCPHCGTHYSTMLMTSVCCLLAPKLEKGKECSGWCAWCGNASQKTFCNFTCSIEYHTDIWGQKKILKKNNKNNLSCHN